MINAVITIVAIVIAVSSIVYAVKLNGRMKAGKSYVGGLLSLYAQLDTSRQAEFLSLLESRQLKQFEGFNAAFLKSRKVKIARLQNQPLLAAVDTLYSWFLGKVLNAYLAAYDGLSQVNRETFADGLTDGERVELQHCLEVYHGGTMSPANALDLMQKDVMEKFVPYMLESQGVPVLGKLERYMGIHFNAPTDPREVFIDLVKTRQLGAELIRNKQKRQESDSDTWVSFD